MPFTVRIATHFSKKSTQQSASKIKRLSKKSADLVNSTRSCIRYYERESSPKVKKSLGNTSFQGTFICTSLKLPLRLALLNTLTAVRSRHGSDSPPDCHSLPCRASLPLTSGGGRRAYVFFTVCAFFYSLSTCIYGCFLGILYSVSK